jgi:hypothetical protein
MLGGYLDIILGGYKLSITKPYAWYMSIVLQNN